MIPLHVIEMFISFLTIGIAYVVSTTAAGYVQAWVAKKCGDSTAEQFGFLTLNPAAHVDPIGAVCLLFLGIGWGKFIPINPALVHNRLYLLFIFLAPTATYILIALCALLTLLWLFGINILNVAMYMVLSEQVPLSALTKIYPSASSLLIAIALIFVMFIYIGVMFAVLNFILNGFRFAIATFLENIMQQPENDLLVFLIPFVLMVLCARPLRVFVIYGISYCAYYIAPLLGVS